MRIAFDQHRADARRGLRTGDVRLRLPGLAARRARQGARAPARSCASEHDVFARPGPERGARRDRRPGAASSPSDAPRRALRRRARHVVRQGPRPRPRRPTRCATRTTRRRLAHRRRARSSSATTRAQVVHAAERVRVAAREPARADVLPGRRPGGARPRPARMGVLARVGAVEPRSRSSRTSPTPPAPRTVAPDRVAPVLPTVEWEGRPFEHTPERAACSRPRRSRWSARCSVRGPRRALAYARANGVNRIERFGADAWLGIVASGQDLPRPAPGARRPGTRRARARARRRPAPPPGA